MDLWILTATITTFAWLYYHFKRSLNYFENLGIPYLPGWPLFGNMASTVFGQKHISETIKDIYYVNPEAKYVGVFDFARPVVMIRDLELIKTVTIKNFDNFADHQAFTDKSLDPLFGSIVVNITGEEWKEERSLLRTAFTSSKMKAMHKEMVSCAENLVNYIAERSAEENKMVETKDLFAKYTIDAIVACVFSISINSLKEPKNDFHVLGRKAINFNGILSLKFFLARSFPEIMRLLKIKFVADAVASNFKKIVSTIISTRDEKKITRPDLLQLMMDARGNENQNLKMDIAQITVQAFTFFFGSLTSSSQMCIIAHELAINPDIQKKLQLEIDDVMMETNGKPTYESINGMPYLDAVYNESMRRHTLSSFLDRICTKSIELPPALPGGKPFTINPGMNIWIPSSAIHMNPKYYDNPEKFDPERYYKKKVSINDVRNLGFGIGPRSCIGIRLTVQETKILFFFLLSKCNLKPNEKTSQPLRYCNKSFMVIAEGGYWLTIEPRS